MMNRQVWLPLMKKLETGYERTTRISMSFLQLTSVNLHVKDSCKHQSFGSWGKVSLIFSSFLFLFQVFGKSIGLQSHNIYVSFNNVGVCLCVNTTLIHSVDINFI